MESYVFRKVKLRLLPSTKMNIWPKPRSDGYSRAKYWIISENSEENKEASES